MRARRFGAGKGRAPRGPLLALAVVAAPVAHTIGGSSTSWADEVSSAALLGLILVGLIVWSLMPRWRKRKGRGSGPRKE